MKIHAFLGLAAAIPEIDFEAGSEEMNILADVPVMERSGETRSYISSDFCLQVKNDASEEWRKNFAHLRVQGILKNDYLCAHYGRKRKENTESRGYCLDFER